MKTYFRTNPIFSQSANIDEENGIIKNIVLCQEGEVQTHELHINNDFINNVTELGNANKQGLKARFGHPNMCSTSLGTYLGRYKNFRTKDNKALADLYLDKSSKKTPNGDLFSYIIDFAKNNPDMFGSSIAFKAGDPIEETIINKDGEPETKYFATIESLFAGDLVDDPAATNSLFSSEFNSNDFAFNASYFLDEHPEIFDIISSKPEILSSFLEKYEAHKKPIKHPTSKSIVTKEFENLKAWLNDKFNLDASGSKANEKTINELKQEFETKLETAINKTSDEIKQYQTDIAKLQSDLNKSNSFPTISDKNADPGISLNKNTNKDNSGKELFNTLPENIKRQLKTNNK